MNTEQMREAFEHYMSDGGKYPNAVERSGEGYRLLQAQNAWVVWQAALAQPAEGGEVCNVKSSAGLIRPGKVDAWVANHYTTPPASQEQAQQPSPQAWANETGLRQIECPSCGDLAVAYDPQQPSGEVVGPAKPLFAVAVAARKWAELQEQGHRMQSIAFDGGPGGPGTIDPWGKVTWGATPKPEPMTQPAHHGITKGQA